MKKKISLFDAVIWLILILWGFAIFYPVYNSILVSFMPEEEYVRNSFAFWVKDFTLDAYRAVFAENKVPRGYLNTLTIIVFSIPLSLFLVTSTAYVMSRKKFLFRTTINNMMVFTMYFSGGLIPFYLLVRNLGLVNKLSAMVVLGALSTYYMVICKSFFYGLPDSLEESAKIDGANDMYIYWKIYLPLSKPILATLFLFILTDKWNEWYYPMIFLSDSSKWPLQLVLREVINSSNAGADAAAAGVVTTQQSYTMGIKMATIVATMLPVMCIYPFLQKYFMSGLALGAVKE